MSSEQQPVWVEWVDAFRGGDTAAREELVTYFTPFVHGLLTCHLAAHVANQNVQRVLDEVLARISEVTDSARFGAFLLDDVRRRAAELAATPGATLEMLGGNAEGKKVLSRLRHLPAPTRELLVLRLLEGVPGFEIAELTGAAPNDIRGRLETGFADLVRELGNVGVTAVGDNYLWSMIGTPHPAVVPLENQLTPLRYDASAATEEIPTSGIGMQGNLPEVTPLQSPSPLERRSGEGRRPTAPEMKTVTRPIVEDDDPQTTPVGVKLVDEPLPPLAEESTSVVPGADAGAVEMTRRSTDLPVAAQENPFAAQPGTQQATDLPVAAQENPFALQPGTQQAADLPVAAAFETTPLPGEQTVIKPLPSAPLRRRTGETQRPVVPHSAPVVADPDETRPRGVPLTLLVREVEAPTTGTLTPDAGQDWRTSHLDLPRPLPAPPPPFSLTRGATPFVMAGVFILFFFAVAFITIRGTEKNVKAGWQLVPVVVASQSMPEGAKVDYDMLSTREIPEQFVTPSVVRPDSVAYVQNQRLVVPVQAGDPLLWTQFETARASERLSRKIHHRARAYTLDAVSITSVGGWIRPGDHVDFIISIQNNELKRREATTTIQNIQILATGIINSATRADSIKPHQKEYYNVSVLALPEEIEMLALMRLKAKYRMVLRNQEDYEMIDARKTTPETLISGERAKLIQRKRGETIIPLIRQMQDAPVVPKR